MVANTRANHFGTSALIAAGVSVLALILLLTVPFGVLTSEGFDNYNLNFAEANDQGVSSWGSLDLMVTGLVIAATGAVVLFILGRTNLPVNPMRTFGWVAAMLLTVGSVLAIVTSSLWVGGGMAENYAYGEETGLEATPEGYYQGGVVGLLEKLIYNPDATGTLWQITPLIVLIAASVLFYIGLDINRRLSPTEGRENVAKFNKYAILATAVVVVASFVPWSTVEFNAGGGDTDNAYFSAQSILIDAGAEGPGNEVLWSTLGYVFNTFLVGVVVMVGAALASGLYGISGNGRGNWLIYPVTLMSLWVLSAWGASWMNSWNPIKDAENYSAGFFQFAVLLPIGGLLAFIAMQFIASMETSKTAAKAN